jgi:chemotaxis protein CheD
VNAVLSSPPSRLERLKAAPRRPGEASFFFYDAHFKNDAVKVLPGEFFVHDEDVAIMTTLGSCIAACLWDRERKVGGMNHFMLPDGAGAADGGRYGSYAMELLINELIKHGARRDRIEAKVFGGGNVLKSFTSQPVGTRNAEFVVEYLKNENIQVVSKVKRLPHAHEDAVAAEEIAYKDRLKQTPVAGSVELF